MLALARRLAGFILLVISVVTLVFALIHLVPGDPIEVMLGESAQAADRLALEQALGLDQPLLAQWLGYMAGLLQLDFGQSLFSHQPISEILAQRIPATLLLACGGLLVTIVVALPLGTMAALHKDTAWDRIVMGFSMLGISIPNFCMGPLLIILFSIQLGWFPVTGNQGIRSLVLPSITLGTALAALLARMVRASLLEVMSEDYIRTARAKGISEFAVVVRHALPNAGLPILTVVGLQLGALLGGAVITETVFAWPGLGTLTVEAIQRRDYPVVQASVIVIATSYVGINGLTDLAYQLLDPRIRSTL